VNHKIHKKIDAAYSFYNVATSIPLNELMNDALILAHSVSLFNRHITRYFQAGFDVFNALDLMDNQSFLEELKFGIGDGNLQYYLYNWKTPEMKPNEVGLVLQ
jgi:glycylpeptide N-tetradecanoyltransferase